MDRVDWSPVFACADVDESCKVLTKMFVEIIDLFAPYKWVNCRGKSAEWVTNDFLGLVDYKHFRCRKFSQNPTPENKEL